MKRSPKRITRATVLRLRWWAEHHDAEQAARWFDTIHKQLQRLAESPESHSPSAENGEFPYVIRDKLLGWGSPPSYRAVFTIQESTVYVLTIQRSSQDALQPDGLQRPE